MKEPTTTPVVVPDDIRRQIRSLAIAQAESTVTYLCEAFEQWRITSPPEQLFYATWCMAQLDEFVNLDPQHPITTPSGQFYADFRLDPLIWAVNISPGGWQEFLEQLYQELRPMVLVEIDGHIWHEKTPEQVEKDKQRERAIMAAGYRVVRFSAREVFRDPVKCVYEANSHVQPYVNTVRKRCEARMRGER